MHGTMNMLRIVFLLSQESCCLRLDFGISLRPHFLIVGVSVSILCPRRCNDKSDPYFTATFPENAFLNHSHELVIFNDSLFSEWESYNECRELPNW